jgi:cell division protein FtsB
MQKINIRKFIYHIRHRFLTFNNLVILTAFLIAAGWVWGSLQVMQRNYGLQKEVDLKRRQLQLAELQKDSLELQKRYYETNEYKELAARESLGLVMPGEKVLILPDNSESAKQTDKKSSASSDLAIAQDKTSNLEQWLNFLFGGYSKSINSSDEE